MSFLIISDEVGRAISFLQKKAIDKNRIKPWEKELLDASRPNLQDINISFFHHLL